MSPDVELVCRCLANEPGAAQELVERFAGEVFNLCQRLLRHRHDAEDVSQEVFLRVFRSLRRWDTCRPLRPWILGIAVNRCRSALAARSRRPSLTPLIHETPDLHPEDDSRDTRRCIQSAVDQLRRDYREVFILFHEQGHSYEEIAEVIERPVGTVKTWLHRARLQVLDHLRSLGIVPGDEKPNTGRTPVHEKCGDDPIPRTA